MAEIAEGFRLQIDELRASAKALLDAVTDSTAKAMVINALRDLDEADEWLTTAKFNQRPSIQQIVKLVIETASWRIKAVREGLDTFGRDFKILG